MMRPLNRGGSLPCNTVRTSEVSVHMAVASNETSTTEPRPVRSRFRRLLAIPKPSAMAPLRSPIAPRCMSGNSRSGGVITWASPPRAQNADASYPG